MDSLMDKSGESEMDVDKVNSVPISVESTTEWKIHDILYDGTERYLKPLTFADHVAKLSQKVDWQKLVGAESSLLSPNEGFENDQVESGPEVIKKSQVETLDPWENVAKNLHQALIEMNVLLDVIQIANDRKYMAFDSVDSMGGESLAESNKMQQSWMFLSKKNIMAQGQRIFETLHDRLTKVRQTHAHSKEANFLNELIELRQAWRLKKLGNSILGDLSYKTYGNKFKPNATFEVKKSIALPEQGPSGSSSLLGQGIQSAIDVVLPKDLERTAQLKIFVKPRSTTDLGGMYNWVLTDEKRDFRAKLDAKPRQRKLENAQRTLLCRDLFAQLSKEAVHLHNISCTVKGDCITIQLPHNDLLIICLTTESELQDDSECERRCTSATSYTLERAAFDIYCADFQSVAAPLAPRPSTGMLTFASRRQRTAGCEARHTSNLQVEQRGDQLLVQRLVARATHVALIARCKEALSSFVKRSQDTLVSVNWSAESTGDWSLAKISLYVPFYESCNRTLVALEIDSDVIVVILKDGEELRFGSDVDQLINYLDILTRQHLITALGVLARHFNWYSLYCSLTRVDHLGDIEPTLMIGNMYGTRSICVKCSIHKTPEILVQNEPKFTVEELRKENSILSSQLWENIRGDSKRVDYKLMTGRCFLHKLELLISALS